MIYPGEDEMQALADGAFRVLKGTETARQYN
jgi:butyrate kinase